MKRLFDENSKYTEDANNLDHAVTAAVAPIIKQFCDDGFCPRDVSYVVNGAVTSEVLSRILHNDFLKYKAAKQQP